MSIYFTYNMGSHYLCLDWILPFINKEVTSYNLPLSIPSSEWETEHCHIKAFAIFVYFVRVIIGDEKVS